MGFTPDDGIIGDMRCNYISISYKFTCLSVQFQTITPLVVWITQCTDSLRAKVHHVIHNLNFSLCSCFATSSKKQKKISRVRSLVKPRPLLIRKVPDAYAEPEKGGEVSRPP